MKMRPSTARAMPMARAAYREADPERSMLGKAALMFLMQSTPSAVLQAMRCTVQAVNSSTGKDTGCKYSSCTTHMH